MTNEHTRDGLKRESEKREAALIEINSVRKPKTSVCTYVLRLRLPVECVKIAANDGNQMPGSSKNVELWNAAGKKIRIGEPSQATKPGE